MSGVPRPRSLGELIAVLAGQRATLHLQSGRDVSGVVTEILPGRADELVVLACDDRSTYVSIATIEAVTVDGVRPATGEEGGQRNGDTSLASSK